MRVLAVAALSLLLCALRVGAQTPCNSAEMHRTADEGRDLVASGISGDAARAAWNRVLDCGGAIAWAGTLYSVDARAKFAFTFDRSAIRVYRETGPSPEAVIPWSDVREIESGNWVIWFRMRTPVDITSDRGKRKRVKELKVYFYGAPAGELTYYYNASYVGRDWFWGTPIYDVKNFRGIAVGPNEFQRRVQLFLSEMFDPERRIRLKHKGKGAGW